MMDTEEPADSFFHENYQVEESSESDEDLEDDGEQSDNEVVEVVVKLGISEIQSRANLDAAGTEVEEEDDRITVANNLDMMSPEVDAILDKIVKDLGMPYMPAEFQRVAINALGEMRNVILVSPTGSGKMNVPLLATLILREKLKNFKGLEYHSTPIQHHE